MPPHATERASGTAIEHATSGNATRSAIARWRTLFWRSSIDRQHVTQVLLSLRANKIQHHWQLQEILVQQLPPLFTPNQEDAFFAMLQQETITDVNLRYSIVDFLARWEAPDMPTYQELLADSAVAQEATELLPKDVPLWQWIGRRLHGKAELIEKDTGLWTLHLPPESPLTMQAASRYMELHWHAWRASREILLGLLHYPALRQ